MLYSLGCYITCLWLQGDEIAVECTYNTTDRPGLTKVLYVIMSYTYVWIKKTYNETNANIWTMWWSVKSVKLCGIWIRIVMDMGTLKWTPALFSIIQKILCYILCKSNYHFQAPIVKSNWSGGNTVNNVMIQEHISVQISLQICLESVFNACHVWHFTCFRWGLQTLMRCAWPSYSTTKISVYLH